MKLDAQEIPFTNGVAVVALKTWGDFPNFVQENENLKGYIFRGHARASFKLAPTLLRLFERRHPGAPDAKDINGQLDRFRLHLRGRVHLTDREAASSSELWAIGQHHGLATILLDWTASPFVAAFFAFIDDRSIVVPENLDDEELRHRLAALAKERDEPRSVVALNAKRLNDVFFREVEKNLKNIADRLTDLASFATTNGRATWQHVSRSSYFLPIWRHIVGAGRCYTQRNSRRRESFRLCLVKTNDL